MLRLIFLEFIYIYIYIYIYIQKLLNIVKVAWPGWSEKKLLCF
jgi:hypothetical protein